MAGPFGIEAALAATGDVHVDEGLRALAAPPDWLSAMEDPDRMRADLERCIPELSSGSLTLAGCKFKRAHIEDGSWTTLHRLKIDDQGERREVDVRGRLLLPGEAEPAPRTGGAAFGTEGWQCYLPGVRLDLGVQPADEALDALPLLTDAGRSRTLLERSLRECASDLTDLQLATCTPSVMRYREGRRCTIRYDLEYPPEQRQPHWPTSVVAKVYEGDEGPVTYDAMCALWASPLRTSTTVTIAEPLAIFPDINVVVQRVVPGEHSLKEHIKTVFAEGLSAGVAALSAPVHKAGRGLAELHASKAVSGPLVTWDTQLDALRHATDELTTVVPDLAGAMQPLVASLETLALGVPAGPLVATHRSFRPAQILVDHDDIAFIDFDGFCQSEAGLDLALFRTTLCDLALRALTKDDVPLDAGERRECEAELDELCATFLAGYEEVGEISPPRLALWDVLTSAKDIVDCWRKVKFEHLERRMEFLHRRLGTEPVTPHAA